MYAKDILHQVAGELHKKQQVSNFEILLNIMETKRNTEESNLQAHGNILLFELTHY